MARRELLITWLNDAHALENVVETALKDQVAMAADHPEVQRALEGHLEATNRHKEIVESCLEELGESPSGVKDTMATIGGKMQGMMQGTSGDTLVKAALNDYSAEHMEIASYQSLIAAANELGHTTIASRLQGVLEDEVQMARWLEDQIPVLTLAELRNEGD